MNDNKSSTFTIQTAILSLQVGIRYKHLRDKDTRQRYATKIRVYHV